MRSGCVQPFPPLVVVVEPNRADAARTLARSQAPFNPGYRVINSSHEYVEYFTEDCPGNTYLGGATQQVTSGLCLTDSTTCASPSLSLSPAPLFLL